MKECPTIMLPNYTHLYCNCWK